MAPGGADSIRKSALVARSRMSKRPSGSPGSAMTPRLPAAYASHSSDCGSPSAARNGPQRRAAEPARGSAATTSAPRSARMRPASRPRSSVRSSTRYRSRNAISEPPSRQPERRNRLVLRHRLEDDLQAPTGGQVRGAGPGHFRPPLRALIELPDRHHGRGRYRAVDGAVVNDRPADDDRT